MGAAEPRGQMRWAGRAKQMEAGWALADRPGACSRDRGAAAGTGPGMGSLLAADPLLSSGFSHQTCIKHFSVCQAFHKNYFTLVPTSPWVGGCGRVGGSLLHFQMKKPVPREGKELAWGHAVPVQTAVHPRQRVKEHTPVLFSLPAPTPTQLPHECLK